MKPSDSRERGRCLTAFGEECHELLEVIVVAVGTILSLVFVAADSVSLRITLNVWIHSLFIIIIINDVAKIHYVGKFEYVSLRTSLLLQRIANK